MEYVHRAGKFESVECRMRRRATWTDFYFANEKTWGCFDMEDEMEVVAAVLLCLWPSRCRQRRCVMHGKKGAICQRRRFHFAFTFKDCLPKENRQTASPEYRSYRIGAQEEEDRSKLSLGTHSSTLEQIFQLTKYNCRPQWNQKS